MKRLIVAVLAAGMLTLPLEVTAASDFNSDESQGMILQEHNVSDDEDMSENADTESQPEVGDDSSAVRGFPSVDIEPETELPEVSKGNAVQDTQKQEESTKQPVVKSNTESYTITAMNAPILSDSVIAGYPWCSLKDVYVSGRDNERQFTILGTDSTKSNNTTSVISDDDIENPSDKEIKKEYGKVIYLSADHNYFIAENGDLCFRTRGRVETVLTDVEARARGGLEVLLGEDYKVYP